MVVLVAAILLWMAVLQLFGRAPMAAFNGDAAQNRKRKKGDSGGRRILPLYFSVVFFSHFLITTLYVLYSQLQACSLLKANDSCIGAKRTASRTGMGAEFSTFIGTDRIPSVLLSIDSCKVKLCHILVHEHILMLRRGESGGALQMYWSFPAVLSSANPLLWWWQKTDQIPMLASSAKIYQCVQASSTASE